MSIEADDETRRSIAILGIDTGLCLEKARPAG